MASGLAGKWMRLAKSSTYYKITGCRSNLRYQWIETTNAESPPGSGVVAEEYIPGVYGGDVDCDIVYQIADAVYASLTPGQSYTVIFYPDKTAPSSNLTGLLCIETFQLTGEIKGYQSAKITGKFTGGYTATSL
jgi:hypothetical protein